ncbi:MAG TPA: hypothetical protein VGK35_05890 [Actinotalea sp.]
MADHSTHPAPAAGTGRGLGPGMTTFLVIDVILVATFIILLVLRLAAGPSGPDVAGSLSPSGSPTAEAQPIETAPASPSSADAIAAFRSPSGNIYCDMTESSATCTILTFSYTPPAGCAGSIGNVLVVTAADGASMPCLDTPAAGYSVPAGTPVLEYGKASTVGEMTCQSSPNGVYCQHNPTGKGFSVAKAGYRLF